MENNNKLAKISLAINAVLIIAVIALFVKMPSGSESTGTGQTDSLDTTVDLTNDGELTIAYYDGDSINNTEFFSDLQNEMLAASSAAEEKLLAAQRDFERWQQGWAEKGQLLPREQEQYMQEGGKKEQNFAILQQQVQVEAAQAQESLMMTLYQRLRLYSTSFSQKNNIDILLQYQKGNPISYCAPHMDVTEKFMVHVDNEYKGGFESIDESLESEDLLPAE
jgi:Skp family chaperone for outer membrane proteins